MKLEYIKTYNWENAIRGMRNPLESWHKNDTTVEYRNGTEFPTLGENDYSLCRRLIKAGTDHRKFIRQIGISCDITMPEYVWREQSTYKIGTVENSTSQMHKLGSRPLTKDDFTIDTWDIIAQEQLYIVNNRIDRWKLSVDQCESPQVVKQYWRDMVQCIPQSFNYTRTCTFNYEVLRNIYNARKNHKLHEWHDLLNGLLAVIPYPEFITDEFIK